MRYFRNIYQKCYAREFRWQIWRVKGLYSNCTFFLYSAQQVIKQVNFVSQTGDRILEVNGFDLRTATHETAVQTIKAASNPVTFVVQSLTQWVSYSNVVYTIVVTYQLRRTSTRTYDSQNLPFQILTYIILWLESGQGTSRENTPRDGHITSPSLTSLLEHLRHLKGRKLPSSITENITQNPT